MHPISSPVTATGNAMDRPIIHICALLLTNASVLTSTIPASSCFLHGEIGYLWIDQTINPWTNAPDLILNSQSINHPGVVLATSQHAQSFSLQVDNGGHMVNVIAITCICTF
jgi:hypothetical protein